MSQNSNCHHKHHCCRRCGKMQPCSCRENRQSDSKSDASAAANQPPVEGAANGPTTEKAELSLALMITEVEEQEYRDLSAITREGDRYRILARNANGANVEIYVDAKTGHIVKEDNEVKKLLSSDKIIAQLEEQASVGSSIFEREESATTAKPE